MFYSSLSFGQITYVTPLGAGSKDGSTWSNALDGNSPAGNGYTKLGHATQTAAPGKIFWIAAGTYKAAADNDRGRFFLIRDGVGYYGGFAGSESSVEERSIMNHQTIFTGDIGVLGDMSDNAYHIFASDQSASLFTNIPVIDGITLFGGNANNPNNAFLNCGGAVQLYYGKEAVIRNCLVSNNNSLWGGAVFTRHKVTVINSILVNNAKAAVAAYDNASISVINSTLANNEAGVYCGNNDNIIDNCIVWGNGTLLQGNTSNNTIVIRNSCVQDGLFGGINANPLFVGPSAGNGIGFNGTTADWSLQSSSPCINSGENTRIPYSVFGDCSNKKRIIGNLVDMGALEYSSTFYSNAFQRNPCSNAVISMITDSSARIAWTRGNGQICKVWIAETGQTDNIPKTNGTGHSGNSSFRAGDFVIEKGLAWFCLYAGTGNLVDVTSLAPGASYRVNIFEQFADSLSCSPLIISFNTTGTPSTASQVFYVKQGGGAGGHDGRSWMTAFSSPLPALSLSEKGDALWIASGTYRPSLSNDRYESFMVKEGIGIYGGFAGNETALVQRNPLANETILSGNIGASGDSLDNSFHVLYSLPSSSPWADTLVIDWVTIRDGQANYPCNHCLNDHLVGGGVFLNFNTLVKISNSRITSNGGTGNFTTSSSLVGRLGGAGIYNKGRLMIISSGIVNNSAVYQGGGIFNEHVLNIRNSEIGNNRIVFSGGNWYNTWGGGGLYNYLTGDMSVDSCTITGNLSPANLHGGGIFNRGKAKFTNSSIGQNASGRDGGGIYTTGPLRLLASHVFSNQCAYAGGGLYANDTLVVDQCLFELNSAHNTPGIRTGGHSLITNSEICRGISTGQAGVAGGINSFGKTRVVNCNIHSNNLHGIVFQPDPGGWFTIVTIFTGSDGGGILHQNDTLWVENSMIHHNLAGGGGSIAVNSGTAYINRSKLVNNFSACGGAVRNKSRCYISGCIVANNSYYNGGLFQNVGASTMGLVNTTISNNQLISGENGNALLVHGEFQNVAANHFRVDNCIVRSNTMIAGYYPGGAGTDTITWSCVSGGFTGTGNFDADPLFISPTSGNDTVYNALEANWRLNACSSCIDSGNDLLCSDPVDLDGNPRKHHRIDLGAFELPYDSSIAETSHNLTGRTITTLHWESSIKPCHTLVFMKDTLAGSPSPSGDSVYSPNAVYGLGSQTDGWYCLYQGIDTTVSVTGLTEGTTYRVAVFNYILDSVYDVPGFLNFNTEKTSMADIIKTYGDTPFPLQAQSSSGITEHSFTIDYDTIAVITDTTATITGAGTATITARHFGNACYLPDSTTASLIVNRALLTVTAADTFRMAGLPNPNFRLIYEGFAYGEDSSALSVIPVATSPATAASPPGQYPIIPAGGAADNYELTYVNGTLTVEINTAAGNEYNDRGVSAYPVPATDLLYLSTSGDDGLTAVVLYNCFGEIVRKQNFSQERKEQMALGGLPPGMYIMEVTTSLKTWKFRIVKQ